MIPQGTPASPHSSDATVRKRLTDRKLLLKNTGLGMGAQILPLLVAVVTIPYITASLGEERFGLLSIGFVLISLSIIFNLGLGRATTKYVSEFATRGHEDAGPFFWGSLYLNTILGLFGIGALLLILPLVVEHFLKIPVVLKPEAYQLFVWLIIAFPFILVSSTLRGMLESGQYFTDIFWVRSPSMSLIFGLPAILLLFNQGLPAIGAGLALIKILEAMAYFYCVWRRFPAIVNHPKIDRKVTWKLLGFGSWLTVSSVLQPLLVYVDRLIIGALTTLQAVSYYTVPSEIVARLRILPHAIVSTLFPTFSYLHNQQMESREIADLFFRAEKVLISVLAPACSLLILYAHPALRYWLGLSYAENGTVVLQILSIGILINSVAWVPYSLVQAAGRPDLTAKFHLIESPIYLILVVGFTLLWGIAGAALAWSARVTLDAVLLFWAVTRIGIQPQHMKIPISLIRSIILMVLIATYTVLCLLLRCSTLQVTLVNVPLFLLYTLVTWRFVFDQSDRETVQHFVNKFRTR